VVYIDDILISKENDIVKIENPKQPLHSQAASFVSWLSMEGIEVLINEEIEDLIIF
jgi:hypothetical protein